MYCDPGERKERRKNWATTRAPHRTQIYEAARKCAFRDSACRYYKHHSNSKWWFEHDADAIWFATVLEQLDKDRVFAVLRR